MVGSALSRVTLVFFLFVTTSAKREQNDASDLDTDMDAEAEAEPTKAKPLPLEWPKHWNSQLNCNTAELPRCSGAEELKAGGFGKVYKVKLNGDERYVAVKEQITNVSGEYHAMKMFNSGYIVHAYDSAAFDDHSNILMEYASNGDLGEVVKARNQELTMNDFEDDENPKESLKGYLQLFVDVLQGVVEMHGAKVIHRDLKPENMFVTGCTGDYPKELTGCRAKVGDLGLACMHKDSAIPCEYRVVGSPGCIAPELYNNSTEFTESVRTENDVWSLGIILYNVVFGTQPDKFASTWEDFHRCMRMAQRPKLEGGEEGGEEVTEGCLGNLRGGMQLATAKFDLESDTQYRMLTERITDTDLDDEDQELLDEDQELLELLHALLKEMLKKAPDDRSSAQTILEELRTKLPGYLDMEPKLAPQLPASWKKTD